MLERSGIVASGLDPDGAGGHVDRRVHDTIATMENQLHRRLTMPELAAAVGLSAAHLTRLFRDATGLTPGAFLHNLRMTRARLLFERTTLSVAEVMAQVGVLDRSHFVRDFQRAHGMSPATLREQARIPVTRLESS